MTHIVQADAQGTLVLPPGLVPPKTAFTVEASGDDVILRRQPDEAERWWATTTPAERVAWLDD